MILKKKIVYFVSLLLEILDSIKEIIQSKKYIYIKMYLYMDEKIKRLKN